MKNYSRVEKWDIQINEILLLDTNNNIVDILNIDYLMEYYIKNFNKNITNWEYYDFDKIKIINSNTNTNIININNLIKKWLKNQ
ncbi:MAG: hypothetical protein ACOCP8_07625 [archaeon]